MFDRIFHMKFLPPGRGLWAMGSPLTEERHLYASLNNCAFVSTEALHDYGKNQEFSKPFTFLMDASMLGYFYFYFIHYLLSHPSVFTAWESGSTQRAASRTPKVTISRSRAAQRGQSRLSSRIRARAGSSRSAC